MELNLRNILGGVALATTLAGGAAVAHANDFDTWDADGNAGINYTEWDAGFGDEGVFDDWDANDDNMLTDVEYNEGVFNSYDRNDDGMLDDNEWGLYEDDAGDNGFWDI